MDVILLLLISAANYSKGYRPVDRFFLGKESYNDELTIRLKKKSNKNQVINEYVDVIRCHMTSAQAHIQLSTGLWSEWRNLLELFYVDVISGCFFFVRTGRSVNRTPRASF